MENTIVPVILKKTDEYKISQVKKNVHSALDELSMNISKKQKILIKPNMLSASSPNEAVTTHPIVLEAVISWFLKQGCSVKVGDSPAVDSYRRVCDKTGVKAVCKKLGVEIVDFQKTSSFTNPDGKYVKRFQLASVLNWADMVVTVPKLKTHMQMYYTGALKNMFGLVSGLAKSKYHLRFIERKIFAGMIVDLNLLARPHLAVIDAVYSMEGNGPRNGSPKKTGFIGVSEDPLALDCVCSRIIGYDPEKIPILNDALSRKNFYITSINEIEVKGDFKENYRTENFKTISYVKDVAFLKNTLPPWLYNMLRGVLIPRPSFNYSSCIKCSKCVEVCSACALQLSDAGIEFNYNKCIQCFCCHEVCPVDAIDLKQPFKIVNKLS